MITLFVLELSINKYIFLQFIVSGHTFILMNRSRLKHQDPTETTNYSCLQTLHGTGVG